MPVKEIAQMAGKRGLISVIDGAHAPGMIPIDLSSIDADFYAANCHKWMMAPCNVGFMHVSDRARKLIEPQITSWGYEHQPEQAAESSGFGGTRWQWSYEFHGSVDRTPQMVLPQTLDFRAELGGDDAVISRCRTLVGHARSVIGSLGLKLATPQNPQLSGAIIAFDFPAPTEHAKARGLFWERHRIECPVTMGGGKHFLRVSCGWFNTRAEIDALASAITAYQSEHR
jgi:isopenicillin-N epimerase